MQHSYNITATTLKEIHPCKNSCCQTVKMKFWATDYEPLWKQWNLHACKVTGMAILKSIQQEYDGYEILTAFLREYLK